MLDDDEYPSSMVNILLLYSVKAKYIDDGVGVNSIIGLLFPNMVFLSILHAYWRHYDYLLQSSLHSYWSHYCVVYVIYSTLFYWLSIFLLHSIIITCDDDDPSVCGRGVEMKVLMNRYGDDVGMVLTDIDYRKYSAWR